MIKSVTLHILRWNAGEIADEARGNVAKALNATAADAVAAAQDLAPRDTGFMANTIEVVEPATEKNLTVVWGNVTAGYTLWQEIGSQGRPGRYFLRGGADRAYPGLMDHMKRVG